MKNYTKVFFLLLLTVSMITLTGCKGKQINNSKNILDIESQYELILEDNNSNHDIKEVIVVQSQEKMEKLFSQINSTRIPGIKKPEINFKEEVLVFAYGGQLSTGGYQLDIVEVINENDSVHFNFNLKRPEGLVTTSITSPVKIIKVNHGDKKITASFKKLLFILSE